MSEPMFEPATDPGTAPPPPPEPTVKAGDPADTPSWLPKKYKTVEAFADGYKNLERKLTELTTPPADYEFGEGVDLSILGDEGVNGFKQVLKDAKVRADQAPEIAKWLAESGPKVVQSQVTALQKAALADAWGINITTEDGERAFNERGQKIVTWAQMELGSEQVAKFGTTPVGILHLEQMLAKRLNHDRIEDVPLSQLPSTDDYSRLSEMIADPRYMTDQNYQRKVQAFREQLEEKERVGVAR